MSTENRPSPPQSNMLPPISMFAPRSPTYSSNIMPASPPSTGYDNKSKTLTILPKPQGELYPNEILSPPSKSTFTTDQNVLWALFNQFQQHKQDNNKDRRASDPISSSKSSTSDRVLTSEEVLAEKRRRNAGASARFRDRRKQREKELHERCTQLDQRVKELENALRCFDQDHPLLSISENHEPTRQTSPIFSEQNTIYDRVGQLEHLMTRFKQEKETDVQKLDELEKENKYLRSLLVPVHLPPNKRSRSSSISDDDKNSRTKS